MPDAREAGGVREVALNGLGRLSGSVGEQRWAVRGQKLREWERVESSTRIGMEDGG
jgi:hypothetical protein